MFYASWYKKGIIKIHHLLNENNFLLRSEFQQKYGVSVDFLTYNGLLSAIPDHGKGQFVIQKKLSFNNSDDHNLTSVNVTAKNARKRRLCWKCLKPRG